MACVRHQGGVQARKGLSEGRITGCCGVLFEGPVEKVFRLVPLRLFERVIGIARLSFPDKRNRRSLAGGRWAQPFPVADVIPATTRRVGNSINIPEV